MSSRDEEHAYKTVHVVSAEKKRESVNRMVAELHKRTEAAGVPFGISPAGEYETDMDSGADIDTWLSGDGYIDYIVPQIYWSDQYGPDGDIPMFSERLAEFLPRWNNDARFYAGLALYRAGVGGENDTVGWQTKDTNLAEQVSKLNAQGTDGCIFFSATNLLDPVAQKELSHIRWGTWDEEP